MKFLLALSLLLGAMLVNSDQAAAQHCVRSRWTRPFVLCHRTLQPRNDCCGLVANPAASCCGERRLRWRCLNTSAAEQASQSRVVQPSSPSFKSLFDGKSLNGWTKSNFGGEGEIAVVDGKIVMQMGHGLTGIHSTAKDFLKTNYELTLLVKRIEGEDMVCGVTFPVNDQFCSFIVGGWGGSTVGLSCIDDRDASDNETTKIMTFRHKQWYRISIQVTGDRLSCRIDDQTVVDLPTAGKKFSLRGDCEIAVPLGIFNFGTLTEIKDVRLRPLK